MNSARSNHYKREPRAYNEAWKETYSSWPVHPRNNLKVVWSDDLLIVDKGDNNVKNSILSKLNAEIYSIKFGVGVHVYRMVVDFFVWKKWRNVIFIADSVARH